MLSDAYFQENDPPADLDEVSQNLTRYVESLIAKNAKVALVTSGGTLVPLEQNAVRFIDNFSTGKRGAACAEYLILKGYHVVFLYRKNSLYPYTRHYEGELAQAFKEMSLNESTLKVSDKFREIFDAYRKAHQTKVLYPISFVTLNDYLFYLKKCTEVLSSLRKYVLYYLAAAVSDFYIPKKYMSFHKIVQNNGLDLKFHPVPKIIQDIVKLSMGGFLVTFKLETDINRLKITPLESLSKYQHQMVVANLLNTRDREVFIFEQGAQNSGQHIKVQNKSDINELIVDEVIVRHQKWLDI